MSTRLTNRLSFLSPLLVLYTTLVLIIFVFKTQLIGLRVDLGVLHAANTILFLVASFAAFWMSIALRKSGGHALLKALYGGFMIRFFVLAGAAFIYILSKRKQVNIPALAGGALFYVLYLVVEIRSLRSVLKSDSSNA